MTHIKAIVFIHNLTESNAHLMPWRTVCEVVKRGREKGHDIRLVSLGSESGAISGHGIPAETISISKSRKMLGSELRRIAEEFGCRVIVWPVVWREPYWRIKEVSSAGVPVIGYLPGGVYSRRDVFYAAKRIGLRGAAPYLADAIWPKSMQLNRWKRCGISHLITMTDFTANFAVGNGWPGDGIDSILPGRDSLDDPLSGPALPKDFREWIGDRRFFLFAGPPSAIRGVYELLEAFELVSNLDDDVCLVCLFRSDAPLDAEKISGVIKTMRNRARVYSVWQSLGRDQLDAFMSEARAIVLPFVAVPSEIPLAIIEAMRYEKPVITTQTGGTGDYVQRFGVSVPLGDVGALGSAMRRLLDDEAYYKDRCEATRDAYENHISWDSMVDQWIECISGESIDY